MAISTARHQFTVADYHRMAEAGILDEDARVELIEGEIVDMAPIGRRHQARVDQLAETFIRDLMDQVIVRIQGSVRLSEHSEPEPDLVLLRRQADFYEHADAGPEDVLLIVEIADRSLAHDRDVKVPLHARAGLPEVWLADLDGACITVYRGPTPEGYRSSQVLRAGEWLAPLAFPDQRLAVAAILGVS
jgi:Uma2 family endonuclease